MEDTASTAAQARAIMLDENSTMAQHLRHWAEKVESTVSRVINAAELASP